MLTYAYAGKFGFKDYEIFLSTRPEKSIGDDKYWDISTNGLIQVEIE
jgi:threonyl-tRNA synthetase